MNRRTDWFNGLSCGLGVMLVLSAGAGWTEAADRVVLCEDFMATW